MNPPSIDGGTATAAVTRGHGLKLRIALCDRAPIPVPRDAPAPPATAPPAPTLQERQRQEQNETIRTMLHQLHLSQSHDERKLNQTCRALQRLSERLFSLSEQYRDGYNRIMVWREHMVAGAPDFMRAYYAATSMATGNSADMSEEHKGDATRPMLLVDDHLGAYGRAFIIKEGNLAGPRSIEEALVAVHREACEARAQLDLWRPLVFDVNYELMVLEKTPERIGGVRTKVHGARNKHRTVTRAADQLVNQAITLLEGNARWLDNLVTGLAYDLAADPFCDV